MLLKTYYNKIIKIEYLKKLVIYDGIYFDEILYEISLEKDIKIFKYPLLSYIVKHKIHISNIRNIPLRYVTIKIS